MRAIGTPVCTCSNISDEPNSGLGAPELILIKSFRCFSRSSETPMLACQRDLFEMPRHVCYLNSASYSPLPLKTQEAGRAAVLRKATPWILDAAFANTQHERARTAAARRPRLDLVGALVGRRADRSGKSGGGAAAARRPLSHRRHPRRRRADDGRDAPRSGLCDLPDLQMAARPLRQGLSLYRQTPSGRHSTGADRVRPP